MKTAAVIAEFNPFHNGHKYLCETARNLGADRVIAVMSGNWVQRGDTAIISKFARAKQALKCGFDLVVELPTYWAMSTAQSFATGAIDIISNLGADMLVFGSECGDATKIMKAAYCIRSKEFENTLKELLSNGIPLAKARETAVEQLCGNGDVLSSPNDTLATEYILAAKSINSKMSFHAVKRTGVDHDSDKSSGDICSASMLRNLIKKGDLYEAGRFMPPAAYEILKDEYENGKVSDINRLEKPILAFLRTASPEHYKVLPDISEGIENRIYGAVRMSATLDELMEYTAAKRYTNARLRRLILAAALGENAENIPKYVPYIRVLGCNRLGADILTCARTFSKLPIIMRATSLKGEPTFEFENKATDIYALSQASPPDCGAEFTNGIIVIKE